MKNKLYFLLITLLLSFPAHAQFINAFAGCDSIGYNGDGIPATNAALADPLGLAVDGSGNVYFSDAGNGRIRKVNTAGIITTVVGNGIQGYKGDGGPADSAELNTPQGVAVDNSGNLYIVDQYNDRIRKVNTSGIITTIAGNGTQGYSGDNGPATLAELNRPIGIAVDGSGNIYITDAYNERIRKVSSTGIITTIAGNGTYGFRGDGGPADSAEFEGPYGIAVDDTGNVYFADCSNFCVRKVNIAGIISTFAGIGLEPGYSGDGGPATAALFFNITGIATDGSGNIYICDLGNRRIRKVNASGIVSTVAGNGIAGNTGNGGLADSAEIWSGCWVAVGNGNVYLSDYSFSVLRGVGWPLAIASLSEPTQSLSVYPNPSSGLFTVSISSNIHTQVQVTITNVLGQKVMETNIFTNSPSTIQLNQPSGIYYLSAISEHGNWSGEITILS